MRTELKKDINSPQSFTDEPEWLREKRLCAWEAYLKEPTPDRVSHLWKYTDPKVFELDEKSSISLGAKPNIEISITGSNNGIIADEINSVIKTNDELVKSKIGSISAQSQTKLNCLNDAFWFCGYFVYIPRNIKLESPIKIKTLCNQLNNQMNVVRNFIFIEEGASISLVDEITSNSNSLLNNIVYEIFLSCGATLNYTNIQTNGNQTVQYLFQHVIVDENAKLNNLFISLGGKLSKSEYKVSLTSRGASVQSYGILLGDDLQKFDQHTKVDHKAPYTRSLLNYRVALKGRAKSAYTGNLIIAKDALKSDAYQENRNLLLSTDAKAETIPELEILTNDLIRCSHGVTVGQIDKEQVYYLMTRGLEQKEAEHLIVEGFFEPSVININDETIRNGVLEKIKSKLSNTEKI